MPPVSKKLLAKVARAVKSAGVPRLARNTFGRAPLLRQQMVGFVAQRLERRGEPDRLQRVELDLRLAVGLRPGPAWPSARRRAPRAGWEIRWRRSALRGAWRRWPAAPPGSPRPWAGSRCCRARRTRRRPSRCPGTAPMPLRTVRGSAPRCRRSRRRDRTPWRGWIPPAAPVGCCARRAARTHRAGRAPAYAAARVMLSAPPRPAAKVAMVARSMFT